MIGDLTGYELVPAAWMPRAACRGVNPELFFPDRGASTDDARAVCSACPVRSECLEYSLTMKIRHGVWGGCSERERRRMARATKLRRVPGPHGTAARYHRGCRCPTCTEANTSDHSRREAAAR